MTDQVAVGIVADADADGQWNARNNEDEGRWNQTSPLAPTLAESEATLEESAVYSIRFPKISHAEMKMQSFPW
jgi:hypothetical protein